LPTFRDHTRWGDSLLKQLLGSNIFKYFYIFHKIGKRKRGIKVRYIWATLYGYSSHGLMVGGGSDGRISSPTKAHGGCNGRVTPHPCTTLDYWMRRFNMQGDAHQMRVGQQGVLLSWFLMGFVRFLSASSPISSALCNLRKPYFTSPIRSSHPHDFPRLHRASFNVPLP